jgi:hypothetical protein
MFESCAWQPSRRCQRLNIQRIKYACSALVPCADDARTSVESQPCTSWQAAATTTSTAALRLAIARTNNKFSAEVSEF